MRSNLCAPRAREYWLARPAEGVPSSRKRRDNASCAAAACRQSPRVAQKS